MTEFMDSMNKRGWHPTARLLPDMVADILAYLKSRPVFPGCHVKYSAGPATEWDAATNEHVLCWDMHDVLRAPHFLNYALERSVYAREWLGDGLLLYSVNAFCTRPGGPVRPDIQAWHRDTDDTKFLPLFIALTDDVVQEIQLPDGEVSTINSENGDAFFSNTMLPHRGQPPSQERIIMWARWGVSDPPASYKWDQLTPIDKALLGPAYPSDPKLQHMIKLVAA